MILINSKRKPLLLDLIFAAVSFCIPIVVNWRLITKNLADQLFITQDVAYSIYPALVHSSWIARQGEFPLWNWHVYSGMYAGGAYSNGFLYPLHLPFFLGWLDPSVASIFNGYLLVHLGIGALGMYFLARDLKFHPYLALLGSCLYGLSFHASFALLCGAAFLFPFAWLPFALIAWRKFALGYGGRWALWGGIAWFLCLLSANPIAIIPIFSLVVLWLVIWGREGVRRGFVSWPFFLGWTFLSFVVAGGLWLGQALPYWESMSVATRNATANYDWAQSSWVGNKGFDTLFRDILWPHYGGVLYASLGAAGTVLFGVGVWGAKRSWEISLVWFSLIIAAVLFLPYALVVYDFAYLLIPLVDRMNGLDRGALAFILPAILVAIAGIRRLISKQHSNAFFPFGYLAIAVLASYVVLYMIGEDDRFGTYHFSVSPTAWFLPLTLHMALFATATFLTLRLINAHRPRDRSARRYLLALALIAFLDTSNLTRNFFQSKGSVGRLSDPLLASQRSSYLPDGLLSLGQASIAKSRVNVPIGQEAMLRSEDNVGGYYQFQPLWVVQAFFSSGFKDGFLARGANSVDTSIKWSIANVERIYDLGTNRIGRAFPVADGVPVQITSEALKMVAANEFDASKHLVYQDWEKALSDYPRTVQWIYGLAPHFSIPPTINLLPTSIMLNNSTWLVAQSPASASFHVRTADRFFFFSNSWHPGWEAFVNGVKVPVSRANYAFMAVPLPGTLKDYQVDFVFRPMPYFLGLVFTLLFAIAWLVLFFLPAKYRNSIKIN